MTPAEPDPTVRSAETAPPEAGASGHRWLYKAERALAAVFFIALGVFLAVAPWMDTWQESYLPYLGPQWRSLWINAYFRGAITGLGVVDLYIGVLEVFGIRHT
jgi:hypothetical protein